MPTPEGWAKTLASLSTQGKPGTLVYPRSTQGKPGTLVHPIPFVLRLYVQFLEYTLEYYDYF